MTGWVDCPRNGEVMFQRLVRDDGKVLGCIMRFYDTGPTYAAALGRRLGPCSPRNISEPTGEQCDDAARGAVERALGVK
jgi:hypothetical protein